MSSLRRISSDPQDELRRALEDVVGLYQQTADAVRTELQATAAVRFPLHPCLRDVWHDHVLLQGAEVTGLIDPAAARTENVASDLSRLLGSLLGDDEPHWEAALEAYAAVRPLSNDERRLVGVLDRSGVLLSGMTWVDRRVTGRLHDADVPIVLPRLRTIQQRLKRLHQRRE